MNPSRIARLKDILQAIDEVGELTAGIDLSTYASDFKVRRAVERCIEIVSEASRYIPPDDKTRFPDVPWPDIAGIGNVLRHEYHRVADPIVWLTATRSLPDLKPVIQSMIGRLEAESG